MKFFKVTRLILVLWAAVICWLTVSPAPGTGLNVFSETIEPVSMTLVAAGDVIMHTPIVNAAYQPSDGSYHFEPMFAGIKDYLSRGDFTVAVLETPLNAPKKAFSGYPQFNAPGAIADALKWAGIDLVFTAHNHSLDQRAAGVRSTVAYLNEIGLPQTGLRTSPEQLGFELMEVKGFKLAFFSVTTSTNGIPLPKGEEWLVNLLDYQKLRTDIQSAKQMGAEIVILALHTGIEYQRKPSKEQQQIVNRLFELGVDIVLGSHVHVIQPYELRTVNSSNDNSSKSHFVVYSLGNLLSNQIWRYSDCGLMMTLEIQKYPGQSGFTFKDINHQLVWVHRFINKGKYRYRLIQVDGPVYSGSDPEITESDKLRIGEVWQETESLFSEWTVQNGAANQ